jgi:hypothetical protein
VDVRRLAADERADLAAFLSTLTPQQWQAPTLCTRWRVRDVVAHVISYDNLNASALLAVAARARFRAGRINDTAGSVLDLIGVVLDPGDPALDLCNTPAGGRPRADPLP